MLADMASKLFLVGVLVFHLVAFSPTVAAEQRRTKPRCHDAESLALLQFKKSFIIDCKFFELYAFSAYSKASMWELESSDCCKWHGVECHEDTGHVVSLDLSNSCLLGPFNSNSSLFQLVHLQKLNLAVNYFYNSLLPSSLRQLSRLTNLNLSAAGFAGDIPSDILELSNLISLDLSRNRLGRLVPSLSTMAQNLTNLKELHLGPASISSMVPKTFSNLSLTSLQLRFCDLYGAFPIGIFHLSNLQFLDLYYNDLLNGSIPEFNQSSPLESLEFSGTNFFGKLPNSIGNLKYLQHFHIQRCKFFGSIPTSFGNLAQLISLDLSENGLEGEFPNKIFHLPNLQNLEVRFNKNLSGSLPEFDRTYPIEILDLQGISFSGKLPHSIGNLTQLTKLDLGENKLHGSIPKSISKLMNLELLNLDFNYLSGIVGFDLLLKSKNLYSLDLSHNNISLLTKPSTNITFPKLIYLALSYCHLHEFPDFLRNQHQLRELHLSHNEIRGQVPNISPLSNLEVLSLESNKLQGSLPIPPPSILTYSVAKNNLTGKVPHLICNLSSIWALDLSTNNLMGSLPQCLGNLSDSLSVLNLHQNNFCGSIPSFSKNDGLEMIDLSQNQLQGPLPRSLANCIGLEVLILGDNQINDNFPFWLGSLLDLEVLILRSNEFYGALENPIINFDFLSLQVMDLSNNDITGMLPSQYFQTWKAMQTLNEKSSKYMSSLINGSGYYNYSMTFINKGNELKYEKISNLFIALDLSNNRFEGKIPEVVGLLKGLVLLNLSNNFLTGHITSSLGNLIELESLDLSYNKLSGAIPFQLVQLNFLAIFYVSHNQLTGPIPFGKQFDTFSNTSFIDNPGLCGRPLSKKCENSEHPHLPPSTSGDNQSWNYLFEFNWKVVAMGYGCGFVLGLVFGITKKHDWFMKSFAVGQPSRRSMNVRQHRS